MSLVISKVFTYDADAGTYIQAVEAADGQALEPATRQAINNFVIGCKQDGIWTAIKASCILAGARTLTGALVPLVGTAPTNNNFVSGDYNRKTGLVGNGSTKYLNSNRLTGDDPAQNTHYSIFCTEVSTTNNVEMYLGVNNGAVGSVLGGDKDDLTVGRYYLYLNSALGQQLDVTAIHTNNRLIGLSRSASSLQARVNRATTTSSASFTTPPSSRALYVQARNNGSNVAEFYATTRLAFYSIGESLDLARLDSRVTDLINAFAVTIP